MSSNYKWDVETTVKFIQIYKQHQCLWNFQSPEYKIKQKRDAAFHSIVQEMNIPGFGTLEVKNKIKNLRSTYQQENKKIQDSKKSGAGLSNVYCSNIKWLKEMEEVFSKDLKRNVYENNRDPTNEVTGSQESTSTTSSQLNNNQEVPTTTSNNQHVPFTVTTTTTTATTTTTTTATTSNTGNTVRAKKRTREITQIVSDLKKLNEDVNSQTETAFDVFGRSVALQLTNLSAENALLAQNRIQNILTEYGIKELRQRSGSRSSSSNYSYQRPSSAYSDTTNDFYQSDEAYVESPPPMTSGSQSIFVAPSSPSPSAPMTSGSQSIFVAPSSPSPSAPMTSGSQSIFVAPSSPSPSAPMTSGSQSIFVAPSSPSPLAPMTSGSQSIFVAPSSPSPSAIMTSGSQSIFVAPSSPSPSASVTSTLLSMRTDDIVAAAMYAAFEADDRQVI